MDLTYPDTQVLDTWIRYGPKYDPCKDHDCEHECVWTRGADHLINYSERWEIESLNVAPLCRCPQGKFLCSDKKSCGDENGDGCPRPTPTPTPAPPSPEPTPSPTPSPTVPECGVTKCSYTRTKGAWCQNSANKLWE